MAKLYSVAEIRSLDPNSIVNSFSGTVTKLGDRKSGKNEKGEWSFQHIRVRDGSGDEIKVTLKDRPELPKSHVNAPILIQAHNSDKGWTGVKAYDDNYNDKNERILWVTGSAKISNGSSDAPLQVGDKVPGTSLTVAYAPPPDPKIQRSGDPIKDAKDYLGRLGNLYGLCLDQATVIGRAHESRNNMSMPPEQFQALTSALFIESNKAHMATQLPSAPMFSETQKPTTPEEDAAAHSDV